MERDDPVGNEIRKLFRAKVQRRQALSRLSFERKILILLHLQKTADEVRGLAGRARGRRWATGG